MKKKQNKRTNYRSSVFSCHEQKLSSPLTICRISQRASVSSFFKRFSPKTRCLGLAKQACRLPVQMHMVRVSVSCTWVLAQCVLKNCVSSSFPLVGQSNVSFKLETQKTSSKINMLGTENWTEKGIRRYLLEDLLGD